MTECILVDETRYILLRRLADNPGLSQRELARELGNSLGKDNYCLKALPDKGYIKAENFVHNYLGDIDAQTVMNVLQNDLLPLRTAIRGMLGAREK